MSDDQLMNKAHILVSLLKEADMTEEQLKDKYPHMLVASFINKVSFELELQKKFIERHTENIDQYYKEIEQKFIRDKKVVNEEVEIILNSHRSYVDRQTENMKQYYKEKDEIGQKFIKEKDEMVRKVNENEDRDAPRILVVLFQISVVVFLYTMMWTLFIQFDIKKFFM
jgi:hypothetical protein